ncbi:MarR family transcriptional regulator [Nitrincola schmidtii]|uniref:MarR family transcriptional regulator n=1 Tax=Nitrincola schmidtii TaxID=1730894 RepID=UPI00124C1253|nr:helix-turn-helix domain-containing protein [Nitrincola schmidtii]
MDSQLFSRTVQALLSDKIICHETLAGEFAFMQSESNLREVGDYLLKIERAVRVTSDGKGYYCAYLDADEAEAKRAIRGVFRLFAGEIEPLVRWMRLARDCHPTGRPIEAGMLVKESELLGFIESSPELNQALEDLTRHRLFKSAATDGKGRINQILNKLEELGYLIKLDSSGSLYNATGRWSYLYDVLSFIRAHERLDDESGDQQIQGTLV